MLKESFFPTFSPEPEPASEQESLAPISGQESASKHLIDYLNSRLRILLAAGVFALGMADYAEADAEKCPVKTPDDYIKHCQIQDPSYRETLKNKLARLDEKFDIEGKPLSSFLFRGNESAKINSRPPGTSPEYSGFNQAGVKNEQLKKLWEGKSLPKGLMENVNEIKYQNIVDQSKSKQYNIKNGQISAYCLRFSNKIVFAGRGTIKNLDVKLRSLDEDMAHELSHSNDWLGRAMPPENRIEFLHDVAEVYETSGTCLNKTYYLSRINNKNKKYERMMKVEEYWGLLCEIYLSMPDKFDQIANEKEKSLIKKWLLSEDPDFDPKIAKARRERMINETSPTAFFANPSKSILKPSIARTHDVKNKKNKKAESQKLVSFRK